MTPPPAPAVYNLTLRRLASSTCAWPAASLALPSSYGSSAPSVLVAANELGVAVGYAVKGSSSGGPYRTLGFSHVDPESMAIVRNAGLLSSNTVSLTSVAIDLDGTTLKSYGIKSGTIAGETGSGGEFVVSFPDFFTSTTPGTVVAF
ncbi:hypothetical protein KRR26_19290 [Corallococcus sp. M34]|uniref:hypothetical protein n=1 Tax=Citreicoccus inhibens TaxID=2849499 RepID=UPI001C22EAAD|nr:hypothetical protein [Citreicoccus inhibens]MBU8897765.1 hypothetical protein [Citreicoccus inhibens]